MTPIDNLSNFNPFTWKCVHDRNILQVVHSVIRMLFTSYIDLFKQGDISLQVQSIEYITFL